MGLLTSDAALLSSPETTRMVRDNAADTNRQWERNFGRAMVKMADIEVKTGAHGEIRKRCRFVNKRVNSNKTKLGRLHGPYLYNYLLF
ncbi:hypothetical protein ACP70R_029907 [Stipagrostis hirtigluma subsp. patula]